MGLVAGPPWDDACLLCSPPVPRGGSSHLAGEVQEMVVEIHGGGQGLCSSALHLPWFLCLQSLFCRLQHCRL